MAKRNSGKKTKPGKKKAAKKKAGKKAAATASTPKRAAKKKTAHVRSPKKRAGKKKAAAAPVSPPKAKKGAGKKVAAAAPLSTKGPRGKTRITRSEALQEIRNEAVELLTRRVRPAHGSRRGLVEIADPTSRPFSQFNSGDAMRAAGLVNRLWERATNGEGVTGLRAVLDEARDAVARDGLELTKHALTVFIAHHPDGRSLPLPRLFEREPDLFETTDGDSGRGFLVPPEAPSGSPPDPEAALNWYREDPFLNEHHEHWHIVYPWAGVNDRLRDRQGELFLYMHEQMLARYDTERLALGMAPAVPLTDLTEPIPEGYDPRMLPRFKPRRAGAVSPSQQDAQQLLMWAEALRAASPDAFATNDVLGAAVESNLDSPDQARFGSLHNWGHGVIADASDGGPGVMASTTTAIRDPIFYRWHRHIDDFSFQYQELQPANDFSDRPPVTVKDLIVCLKSQVLGTGEQFGQHTFGGANWGRSFAGDANTTDVLSTRFDTLTLPTTGAEVTYLDHDEFAYFIRIDNTSGDDQTITLRLWLVAQELANERRMWIELDTFQANLSAGRNVVYRPSDLSSVVRKEDGVAVKPTTLTGTPGSSTAGGRGYCECGWPYNLLLPRGRPEGMSFHLMAMATWKDVNLPPPDTACGSVSLCGTKEVLFPDERSMGYPFDRPFAGTVLATLRAQPNVNVRDLSIRFVPATA